MGEFYKEYLDLQIIEEENAFISYGIIEDKCHIEDLYIRKGYRKLGLGSSLADKVTVIAKECGCTKLTTYSEKSSPGCKVATKAFLAYGFDIVDESEEHIYFEKKI